MGIVKLLFLKAGTIMFNKKEDRFAYLWEIRSELESCLWDNLKQVRLMVSIIFLTGGEFTQVLKIS